MKGSVIMAKRAEFCMFLPPNLTEEEAQNKLALHIDRYPPELFKFISYEDITPFRYFITSYGRIFLANGKELFPAFFNASTIPPITYLSINLTCTSYYKNRRFLVHRLVGNTFIPKTEEDIAMERNIINHKYNKDGICNYVWNLEWTTIKENTIHGLTFNEKYDPYYFDPTFITNRFIGLNIMDNRIGEMVSKAKISEYQAHLICFAYTKLNYSVKECAEYAWLEVNKNNLEIVRGIIKGYTWKHISCQYGISPKIKNKCDRPSNIRPGKKNEYKKISDDRNYK